MNQQLAILQGMLKEAALAGRPAEPKEAAGSITDVRAHNRVIDVDPVRIDDGAVKAAKQWIDKAIKHPAAANKGGKLGQRARLAETLKGMHHKKGAEDESARFVNHMSQLFKISGVHAATRDTKKKETQQPPKPGVEKLESASDTKPKAAPEKKPEPKASENEVEKAAAPGGVMRAAEYAGDVLKSKPMLELLAKLQQKIGGGARQIGGQLKDLAQTKLPGWVAPAAAAGGAGATALGAYGLSKKPGGPKPEDIPQQGSDVSKLIKDTRAAKAKRDWEASQKRYAGSEDTDSGKDTGAARRRADYEERISPGLDFYTQDVFQDEPYAPTSLDSNEYRAPEPDAVSEANAEPEMEGEEELPAKGEVRQPEPSGGGAFAMSDRKSEGEASQRGAQAEQRGKDGAPAEAGTPGQQDLVSAIREGLGNLGGGTMGTVGSALSGLGLPGEDWLKQKAQDKLIRELVGGGTAAGGTALTAYLVSKLLGGNKEASLITRPYHAGFALGTAKLAYALGRQTAPPETFKEEATQEFTPRRQGVVGTKRQEHMQRLNMLTR